MNTAARRRLIRKIVADQAVASQGEIVEILVAASHDVTQATVSRDLQALGATKSRVEGQLRYVLPDDPSSPDTTHATLARVLAEFVDLIASSGDLVVVKTAPGAAGVVAGAIDAAQLVGVLGTIAGDDTLVVIADEDTGGLALATHLEQIGAG